MKTFSTYLTEKRNLFVEKEEKETKGDKEVYQKKLNSLLKKYKVKSIAELSKEDKPKFFKELDKSHKSDDEQDTGLEDPTKKQIKKDDEDDKKSLKESQKIFKYFTNNYKDHLDSSNVVNGTTLAEDYIDYADIDTKKEDKIFDLAIDWIDLNKVKLGLNESKYDKSFSEMSKKTRAKLDNKIEDIKKQYPNMNYEGLVILAKRALKKEETLTESIILKPVVESIYQFPNSEKLNIFISFHNEEIVKPMDNKILEKLNCQIDGENGRVKFGNLSVLGEKNQRIVETFLEKIDAKKINY